MPHPIVLSGGFSPVVLGRFNQALGDYTTLSTTSSMPTGGLITRAGNAMVWVNDGGTAKLTWAPNNLLLQSNTFTTTWTVNAGNSSVAITSATTDPFSGNSAYKLSEASTAVSTHEVRQISIPVVSGTVYMLSVYVKAAERTQVNFQYFDGTTNKFPIFNIPASAGGAVTKAVDGGIGTSWSYSDAGNGWYRIAIYAAAATTAGQVYIYPATGSTNSYAGTVGSGIYIYGAQVEAVTYQTTPSTYVATTTAAYYGPRFDYDPATLAAKGLLVEGTLQQLLSYSEQFNDTAWTAAGSGYSAPTPNAAISPDGTQTADQVTETATTSVFVLGQVVSASANISYTASCYFKRAVGTRNAFIQINLNGGTTGAGFVWFDLTNLTVSASSTLGGTFVGGTATIQSVGNGWYRCVFPFMTNTGTTGAVVYLGSYNGARSYAGDGSSALYFWGAQLEARGFASSYLPTQGGSSPYSTRAAETFTLANYTNRLVESFYIDEETGGSWSANINASATSPLTISTPTFGWVTSLRAYTNAYAGDISTPSWIDNSGTTGNRMYYDSTGALTWAPANLLQKSTDFSPPTWVNGSGMTLASGFSSPDGGSNGWKYTTTNTTSQQYNLQQGAIAAAVGQTITVSCYVKYGNSQWVAIGLYDTSWYLGCFDTINGVNGTVSSGATMGTPVNVGNGWYRISLTRTIISSNFYIGLFMRGSNSVTLTWTPNGTEYNYFFGSQAETVTYQTSPRAYIPTTSAAVYQPRYDYDPSVTPATPRGMLIEEQRVNLLTYSQDYTQTDWTKTNLNTSGSPAWANVIVAPDGTTTAEKLIANTTSGLHTLRQDVNASNIAYTFSIYLKAAEFVSCTLQMSDNATGDVGAIINLAGNSIVNRNFAAGSWTNTSFTLTPLANGWYRGTLTATKGAGTQILAFVRVRNGTDALGNGSESYAGNDTSGLFAWGAQLEAGSFATSYIPTTTASVTRVADVVKLSGSALTTLQGSAGSVLAETNGVLNNANYPRLVGAQVTGGGAASFMELNPSNTLGSNFNGYFETTTTATWTNTNRGGMSWSLAGRSLALNNGTVATNANAPTTSDITVAYISGPGNRLGGYVQSLAIYNQRLPDTILKAKSVVGSPY